VKVRILAVGTIRGPLAAALSEYEGRAGRYWKLEVTEVASGGAGRHPPPERVLADEARRLLARIGPDAEPWALTREGAVVGSRQLARDLEACAVRSVSEVVFVIGGAFGLDGSVLQRATRRVSLSALTLPHEMARLVLAEQLYRAGTILRNEPYHKGA